MTERIQKLLATAGVASRREIERLIEEGRILVNGRAAEAGQKISHEDSIRVDGRPVSLQRKAEPARVLIYKKRTGELVTRDDPEGRRTVFRKLPKLSSGRWIAVGRLDINTSGLLLFTNHGELARRLTHPSFEIPRTYAVRVLGTVDDAVIARWKAGVELDDGKARFERVEHSVGSGVPGEEGEGANQWFHVTVREGRNRLVRRLIESQDLQVSRLIRISYGPIDLGRGIKSGTAREATPGELLALLDAVRLSAGEVGIVTAPKRGRPGAGWREEPPARPEKKFERATRGERSAASRQDERPQRGRGDGTRGAPLRRDGTAARKARGDDSSPARRAQDERPGREARPARARGAAGTDRARTASRPTPSSAARTPVPAAKRSPSKHPKRTRR